MDTTSIVCPHCFVKNRVPQARLADAPKCGGCHEHLFTGRPIPVNAEQMRKMLAGNDIPVIVDYWASWCGPCRMFAPTFAEAAESLEPKIRLLKLDTENNQQVASNHNIRSIPTLIMFRDGREIRRESGVMSLPQLLNWVAENPVT